MLSNSNATASEATTRGSIETCILLLLLYYYTENTRDQIEKKKTRAWNITLGRGTAVS